jgi:hypothetical protein
MRLRLLGKGSPAFRAFIAAILFCGVGLTVGLSAAPQLHDRLHKSDGPSHECAATLLSSGSVDHSHCEPVLRAPVAMAAAHFVVTARVRVIARTEFSILEHAPPANS